MMIDWWKAIDDNNKRRIYSMLPYNKTRQSAITENITLGSYDPAILGASPKSVKVYSLP